MFTFDSALDTISASSEAPMRTLLIAILLMLAILPGCCLISLHPLGNLAEKSAPPTPELPS